MGKGTVFAGSVWPSEPERGQLIQGLEDWIGQRPVWAPCRPVAWVTGCCTGEAHACCPLVAAVPHFTPSRERKPFWLRGGSNHTKL